MAARSKRFRVADESTRADHGDKGSEPVSVCRNSYIILFIYLFGFLFFLQAFISTANINLLFLSMFK